MGYLRADGSFNPRRDPLDATEAQLRIHHEPLTEGPSHGGHPGWCRGTPPSSNELITIHQSPYQTQLGPAKTPPGQARSSTPQIGNRAHRFSGSLLCPHSKRNPSPGSRPDGTFTRREAQPRQPLTGPHGPQWHLKRREAGWMTQGSRTAAGLYGYKATIDPGYLIHPQLSIVRCELITLRTRWATTSC